VKERHGVRSGVISGLVEQYVPVGTHNMSLHVTVAHCDQSHIEISHAYLEAIVIN
jgi:hypothetical protein